MLFAVLIVCILLIVLVPKFGAPLPGPIYTILVIIAVLAGILIIFQLLGFPLQGLLSRVP